MRSISLWGKAIKLPIFSGRILAGLALPRREALSNETGSITQTFQPSGMHISDDVKGTSPDRLTGTDVMAAIGTTSNRARFGLAAFFGKAGISKTDEQLAVQALARYAMKSAQKNVRKAAGSELDGVCRCWRNLLLLNIPVRRRPA